MKKCNTCKNLLPVEAFSKNKASPDGIHWYCKNCINTKVRSKGPNPKNREMHLRHRYGLSLEEFDRLNDGYCPICDVEFDTAGHGSIPVVDHDHETGKNRGIICWNCNVGIGRLHNSKLTEAATLYHKAFEALQEETSV